MKIAGQLLREFWLPSLAALIWTATNIFAATSQWGSWTKYINIAAPTFFFVSWLTGQYFRVKKQEHVATTLGIIETRVEGVLGKVESQAKEMGYLVDAQIIQTFDEIIDLLRETKDEVADSSRELKLGHAINVNLFKLLRENPFYACRKFLRQAVSYAQHTVDTGRQTELEERYTRCAYHIEELAGNLGRFIRRLDHGKIAWKTGPSATLILGVCDQIDEFRTKILPLSRYHAAPYKGGQKLHEILTNQANNLRALAKA